MNASNMKVVIIAGWRTANFQDVYRHRVDYWQWFDNSGDTPRLNDEGGNL